MRGSIDRRHADLLSRRGFLRVAVGGTAVLAGVRATATPAAAASGPFLHGVASGDPLTDRVIIWTRVTPTDAAVPGSGIGPPVLVRWQVARDPDFSEVVESGELTTSTASDHTVHVDVAGLEAGRDHWYRFEALGETSPVGRTRTAPARGAVIDCIRLGVVTCAEYEFGYFGAYRHLAGRDDVDAVLHLGDYIYEFGIGYGSPPTATATPGPGIGRGHVPAHECVTLADYRARYGSYHRDPDLIALHAAHPMMVMYDDHEVANDTWREGAQNHQPEEGDFATRAGRARRAFREWMPLRRVDPHDAEVVHRAFRFGDLIELWMLDERRYRDVQPQNAFFSYGSVDPAIDDPDRTMLGAQQKGWLVGGLQSSDAAWKVLGNPVPFFPFVLGPALATSVSTAFAPLLDALPPVPPPLTVDDWNGYAFEQQSLIQLVETGPVDDVVVLTGDYHESFVADVPPRPGDYRVDANSVAVEFVAPSVTSPGLGETLEAGGLPDAQAIEAAYSANLAADNPWVRYHEGRSNGFGVFEVTTEHAQYDFWFLDDRLDPESGARAAAYWEIERGAGRATEAARPLPDRVRSIGGTTRPPVVDDDGELPATGGPGLLVAGGAAAAAALAALAARRVVDGDGTPEA